MVLRTQMRHVNNGFDREWFAILNKFPIFFAQREECRGKKRRWPFFYNAFFIVLNHDLLKPLVLFCAGYCCFLLHHHHYSHYSTITMATNKERRTNKKMHIKSELWLNMCSEMGETSDDMCVIHAANGWCCIVGYLAHLPSSKWTEIRGGHRWTSCTFNNGVVP